MRPYIIDLAKIEGEGGFKCPKCGTWLSPDDITENTFIIVETVMKEENLEKLVLQCRNCQSEIHLTGFKLLNKLK